MERLRPHMLKHCTGALSPSMGQFANCHATIKEEISADPEQPADKEEPEESTSAASAPPSLSAEAAAGRASALHALSFMSPLTNPYGIAIPPTPQSIYANPGEFTSFFLPI